jgi:ribosome-associated protein
MTDEIPEEEIKPEGRGRAAAKRVAKAIEEIALQLTELPESALGSLPLDEGLMQELLLARSTRGHGSRKRQIKHFAGRLRRYDRIEELDTYLNGEDEAHQQHTQAFHDLEQLRDRLCTAATFDAALAEIKLAYPLLNHNKLARLARNVHVTGDKKSYRDIFRQLRKMSEQPTE